MEPAPLTTYEKALDAIELADIPPAPDAPSCHPYRLRPSEEALILQNRYLNPPPPWGQKINLSKQFLGPERCTELGYKLILNQNVTYLDLSMCDMQSRAAVLFFSCLQKNKVLRHLNVNGNDIGDAGATAAAALIGRIETLHMSSNNITDVGCVEVANAVRNSNSIRTINLRNNRITAYGIFKLMDALEPSWDLISNDAREAVLKNDPTNNPPPIDVEEPVKQVTKKYANRLSILLSKSEDGVISTGNSSGTNVIVKTTPSIASETDTDIHNTTLHTLWIDCNIEVPETMMRSLAHVLAKRYPEPPKGMAKKSKGGKQSAKR